MSRRQLLMLLALAAIWGSSFMFIKVAVREIDPATVVLGRSSLAALTLALIVPLWLPVGTTVRSLRAAAWPLIVVGVLNSAVPFWLLNWAETRIDSGVAAVLQASAPLFTALLALGFVRSERVSGARLVGFVVGFAGVAVMVGAVPSGSVLAALAVVAAAFCYAAGALIAGRTLGGTPLLVVALGTMLTAAIVSLPFGLAQLPSEPPGWKALASIAVLGIAGSAIAYLLYFGLITGAGASYAILVTYLVPPMALAWGAALLDEPIDLADLGGLALILAGVALGTGSVRRRRAQADSLAA
jgi:drug/metabolite transporter (DMT)-like permease